MTQPKKSMNPIPPTLRGKKRYIKFRLMCSTTIRENEARNALYTAFSNLFGEQGIAQQKLWPVKWMPEQNSGIVRCSLPHLEEVKAGLLFIRKTGGNDVIPVIVAVSGSVKKLKGN